MDPRLSPNSGQQHPSFPVPLPATTSAAPLTATLALDLRCTLGEGVTWNAQGQCWLWTDIEGSCLYRWAGNEQPPRRYELADRLGSFAPALSGRILLGLAKGLAWGEFSPGGLAVTPLVSVDAAEPRTRINDGRTDRGTSPGVRLYRLDGCCLWNDQPASGDG